MTNREIRTSSGNSRLSIGRPFKELKSRLASVNSAVITDRNVRSLYGNLLSGLNVIEIGVGEKFKNLATLENIYRRFLDLEMERSSLVVGMGGGIVCDIAGLAGSTYMRGIRFGLVPTTLLAQVDASIGGKNGINFDGYKNIIGVFKQPEFIHCDFAFLKSLSRRELLCGIAEIIKHAAAQSTLLFEFLESQWQKLLFLRQGAIKKAVEESIRIKSSIVVRDETEKGERKILNFGHTLGHALEKTSSLPHGEAVRRYNQNLCMKGKSVS